MTYKAIGFDWGGVINGKPGRYFGIGMAKLLGISEEEFMVAYFNHNKGFNRGEIDQDELWQRILVELHREHRTKDVFAYITESRQVSINQNVIDLIDTLKKNGYKVGLLSNNTLEGGQEMREIGLDKHFDVFHISAETGDVKPEPIAFTSLAEALEVAPSELIFIDDSPKSLESAGVVGFAPLLYDTYDQCITDLNKLDINTSNG